MPRKAKTHRRLRRSTSRWSWKRTPKEQASNLDAFVTSNLIIEEQTKMAKVLDEMEKASDYKEDYYPTDDSQLFL